MLNDYFETFKQSTIGSDTRIETNLGNFPLVYADWAASGRHYWPIELRMLEVAQDYGNSHSDDSHVGAAMSNEYKLAHELLKRHVNAGEKEVVSFKGTGMTGAVNWFQRAIGLWGERKSLHETPVVFITHMEHHSNQISWIEAGAQIEIIEVKDGLPNLDHLEDLCKKYAATGRPMYGSFTACSNVTGIETDYHAMAKIMHKYRGRCFVDFAGSAPYVHIDMHPPDPDARLDAIFFSPHKFLGGPGSSGVVVFNSDLYAREVPVNAGGAVVRWTNPWGQHRFIDDIAVREDAGTPGFLQSIRAGKAIELKEQMEVEKISAREGELVTRAFKGLQQIPGLKILEADNQDRKAIISFIIPGLHYGLIVKILNDRFGVQARGGCSCAGTYGHYLFGIDKEKSQQITDAIDAGDYSKKPGWVRISLHPTTSNEELDYILEAIGKVARNGRKWSADYSYDSSKENGWNFKGEKRALPPRDPLFRR